MTNPVTRIATGVNFRQREGQRAADHERFLHLSQTLVKENTFKQLEEFDQKLEALEVEKRGQQPVGGKNNANSANGGANSRPGAPKRGILQPKEPEKKPPPAADPRKEEIYKLNLYRPKIAEEGFRHDYGDASRQLLAVSALQRQHRNGEKIPSKPRYLTNYPCGAQHTWNLMEAIYLRPTVDSLSPPEYQKIEHQPLVKAISFSEVERENEQALRNLFMQKKGMKGLKELTNAFAKQYAFTMQGLNQKRILSTLEEQRCYDGRRGYSFKDNSSEHFEWLEKNASFREQNEVWLHKKQWSEFQKKTWDILVCLHRDYFKTEKKSLRCFFLQRAKKTDEAHWNDPYAPESGYVLDGARMLANLELWGVVNSKGKPTLTKEEMYPFLQLLGEHYEGAVSYSAMKKVMETVRMLYPKWERAQVRKAQAHRLMQAQRGRALEGSAVSKFAKAHWGESREPFVVQSQVVETMEE